MSVINMPETFRRRHTATEATAK